MKKYIAGIFVVAFALFGVTVADASSKTMTNADGNNTVMTKKTTTKVVKKMVSHKKAPAATTSKTN